MTSRLRCRLWRTQFAPAVNLGWTVERVCCIYPAVLLFKTQDIQQAHDVLERGDSAYVFPVTTFPSPIQRALRRGSDGVTRPFYPEYVSARTQDLEPAYYDAGQFYWGAAQAWVDGLSVHNNGAQWYSLSGAWSTSILRRLGAC